MATDHHRHRQMDGQLAVAIPRFVQHGTVKICITPPVL